MEPAQRPLFALMLRLVAVAVLASLFALVKYTVESGVAFAEVLFWRQVLTVPILLGWLAARGEVARLRTARLGAHARRAASGTFGMTLTFGAPLLLPLAVSTTLGFTTPLFAVLLSALVLRERVGRIRWLAVALGFAGVLVIAQPGQAAIPALGALVGLGAGFMVAVISIQVRDLGKTEEPLTTVFWFAAISSPVLALALPFVVTGHTPLQWQLLLAAGALGCAGQLLLTAALRFGQVASVIVMDYTALVWATLYGWALWDELPPASTWLGAPLIIAAGAVVVWREQRLFRRAAPASASGAD
ncbi:MAG: DMT family transporter [Novosphingobium sp.]